MILAIPDALGAEPLAELRRLLTADHGSWVDGRVTAGHQGAPVKRNVQIDERAPVAQACQRIVLGALERDPRFISATLPNTVYPPMVNRHEPGMHFGPHVDGSVRIDPATGRKLRTDVSATLFLSDPADYDGGELAIHDRLGLQRIKLPAGSLVVYPATTLHEVTPITRGVRLACFFWVQSLVRDDHQREILYDLDTAIQALNRTDADADARRTLVGTYHNLMRLWSDT